MDDFSPRQLIILCAVFLGFHALALPPFLWAMRHRQFSGREQKEWHLDSEAAPERPSVPAAAQTDAMPLKAQIMLSILGVLAALMLGSVVLTLFTAMHATAHPAMGQSPY